MTGTLHDDVYIFIVVKVKVNVYPITGHEVPEGE